MIERGPKTRERPSPGLLLLAALLSLGAAVIHVAVAPEHLAEFWAFGAFFTGAGVVQAALAVAMLAVPARRLLAAALVGTLGVLGLWVVSRTAGVPIGPHPWVPEAIGMTDIACTLMEVIEVAVLAVLVVRRPRPRRQTVVRFALKAVPSLLLAGALTAVGTAGAVTTMPAAF